MGWLIGPTLASFVAAFIVVKIFDYLFAGAMGGLGSTVRAGLFVGTWTAVTTKAGMHGFNQKVRRLRQGNQRAIKAISKGGHSRESRS